MTNQTSFMRCQGGQPQGVKEQAAVAPTFLDAQFHWAQSRLKSNALKAAVRGGNAVRPIFTGLQAKTNRQRLAEYEQKMARYTGVAA